MIRVQLKDGDVPAVEVEGTSGHGATLKIHDDKGDILVQAQLTSQERREVIQALTLIEVDHQLIG